MVPVPTVAFLKLVLGVLLAGLGVILLAGHLGYLPAGTGGWLFQYWPVLLIALGLGLLASSLQNPIFGWIATILIIGALGYGAWWAHQHGTAPKPALTKRYDLNRPRAETVTVSTSVFGGSLDVGANAPARGKSLDVTATGVREEDSVPGFSSSGGTAILDWPASGGRVFQAPIGGDLRVLIPERLGVRLLAKSLFSRVRAGFARLRPERCEVTAIASSVQIDASGPAHPSLVRLRGTLSNVELTLPANCAARLEFASPLTFRTLPDDFVEHVGGRSQTKIWTSEGSGPAVLVRVEGPLMHLKIRREPVRAL
ncbi:MAG: hypothetical protein ACM3PF_00430 [Bacteroidota bacterium]